MAVRNLKIIRPFHWIPPNTTPKYKLEVIRSDGTIDDISDLISRAIIEDHATESIGRFEFELWNPDDTYSSVWTGNETFKYYKDYAADATTLWFKGRLEKPSKRGHKLNVKGRSESLKLMDLHVTASFDNVEASVILTTILGTHAPWVTTANVNVSTVTMTVNWYQKPFWECVQELTTATGFDAHLAADDDFNFFLSGSIVNSGEAIVHSKNLLEVEDFTPDVTQVRNQIIVSGAVIDGIQIIYTSEDAASQSAYGVKEHPINDDNITNETQAQEVGDFELARQKDPPDVGSVKAGLLATIQPGESLNVSSPSDNIPPGPYPTTGYKDVLDLEGGELSTTVYLNKEPRKLSHVLRDRVEAENRKKNTNLNPEGMGFSKNYFFNEDSGTHSSTEIVNGVLKPTAGSGVWTSDAVPLSSNLTEAYLLMVGETLTGASVEISGNNGVSYQSISNKSKITLSSAIGPTMKIRITFSNADTQIQSLSIQYNKA